MERKHLFKESIIERIEVLEDWIQKGSFVEMTTTAVTELNLYKELLIKLEESGELTIINTVHTEIYQQIGILI